MKKGLIIMVLAGLFVLPALSQNPPLDKNWEVVFVDNFSSFNTSRWNKGYGPHNAGQGQGEGVEFCTDGNVYIENGKLVLRTQKENQLCTHPGNCRYADNIHKYTSGSIGSHQTYKYGYFEMYAKLPTGSGYSPTFWLWNAYSNTTTGNCWYNEINVIEVRGDVSNEFDMGIHCGFECPEPYNNQKYLYSVTACNYAADYHWYGLEWDRDKVTWYVDRKAVRQDVNNIQNTGVQHAMYLFFSVGLYERKTDDHYITPSTEFPQNMYIDQINHYRLKCDDKNTVVNEISNYNTFNYTVKKSISLSGVSSLSSGQNVSLRATDFIELKAGFEVPVGAELYLDVNPCE